MGVGGVAILGGENVFCLSVVADHQCTATGSMLCGLLAETTVLICAANHKDIQECYESVFKGLFIFCLLLPYLTMFTYCHILYIFIHYSSDQIL